MKSAGLANVWILQGVWVSTGRESRDDRTRTQCRRNWSVSPLNQLFGIRSPLVCRGSPSPGHGFPRDKTIKDDKLDVFTNKTTYQCDCSVIAVLLQCYRLPSRHTFVHRPNMWNGPLWSALDHFIFVSIRFRTRPLHIRSYSHVLL